MEGLRKIVALKASMNLGLSDQLGIDFPNITPAKRPSVLDNKTIDPQWLAGFISGEGCFFVKIFTNTILDRSKVKLQLEFKVTQHSRDEQLMRNLIECLNCGSVFKHSENTVVFKVSNLPDLSKNILPFFLRYSIIGVKSKDFKDFCKVVELMKNKAHLTEDGLDKIRQIKLVWTQVDLMIFSSLSRSIYLLFVW